MDSTRYCKSCDQDVPEDGWQPSMWAKGKSGNCRACTNAYSRKKYADNPHPYYLSHVKYAFGLTSEQLTEMNERQNYGCAICGKKADQTVRGRLSIDHDEKTKEIRGLLCGLCNHALGELKDDPELFLRAREYLLNPPCRGLKAGGTQYWVEMHRRAVSGLGVL